MIKAKFNQCILKDNLNMEELEKVVKFRILAYKLTVVSNNLYQNYTKKEDNLIVLTAEEFEEKIELEEQKAKLQKFVANSGYSQEDWNALPTVDTVIIGLLANFEDKTNVPINLRDKDTTVYRAIEKYYEIYQAIPEVNGEIVPTADLKTAFNVVKLALNNMLYMVQSELPNSQFFNTIKMTVTTREVNNFLAYFKKGLKKDNGRVVEDVLSKASILNQVRLLVADRFTSKEVTLLETDSEGNIHEVRFDLLPKEPKKEHKTTDKKSEQKAK